MGIFLMSPYLCSTPQLSCGQIMFRTVPIMVEKLRDRRKSNSHWHDYLQIWYTVSGQYRHTVNGVTYPQKAGDAMLVFPYMTHSIDSSESDLEKTVVYEISIKKNMLEKYCIPFLSHSFCSASFDSFYLTPNIHIPVHDREKADIICSELSCEYKKKMAMHTTKMFNNIARFLELCIKNSVQSVSSKEIQVMRTRLECIDEAMAYILANSSDKLTLDEISSIAMMSRTSFATSFNEVIGQTCHSYIGAVRMSNAIGMLRKTRKSVSQIAVECGFSDASHFTRACNKMYGVTPLVLRKEYSKWAREYGDMLFKRHMRERSWAVTYDDELLEKHWCEMSFY